MNVSHIFLLSLLLASMNPIALAEQTSNSSADTPPTPKTSMAEEPTVIDQGKQLHDKHCVSCHDTSVYTRKDRMIKSYDSLKTHVQRCATQLDKQWFEDEVAAVAAYLNKQFYLFKTETTSSTDEFEKGGNP